MKDYHKVTELIPEGDVVNIKTNKGDFRARKVVVTTGPWGPAMAKKLGIELPFKVHCKGNGREGSLHTVQNGIDYEITLSSVQT